MKHTHAEGPGSILKSRFARVVVPLVAALFACALAAPEARAAASVKPGSPAKVDTSSAAGAVDLTRSSAAHPTYGAAGAFDGQKNVDGRWLAVKADHMFVTYRFNTATKVTSIKLYNPDANNETTRPPKAWTFEGSNDGDNWTVLDTRTGQTWSSGQVRSYSFQNDDAYVYYKFDCTELNGATDYLMLWEIEFWGTAPGEVPVDLTSPSGTVTTTTAGDWVKPAKNAFDNGTAHNNDDRSIHSGTTVDWIYTFDSPTKVNAYSLYSPGTAAYNYDKRMPKTWTFEAKNAEDATWTVLDTQSSETGWSALESRYYEFVNNTAYTSYRFAVTAVQNGSDDYVQLDELEFYFINDNGPLLGDMSLSRTAALSYSLSAAEAANAAELSYIIDDGTSVSTNGTQAVAEGGSAIWTISGLAADTTWRISVLAENASGTDEKVAGTLFTGELALGATTNAQEYGLVPGGVVVSRGVSDPFPLVVNYSISGSAGTEGTTWAAPEPVTIPANESSAVLPVVPLMDGDVTSDVTITVALAAGNYELPASNAATLTLLNIAAPAGKKTWVATANGNASDGANWSPSGAPTETDEILFDDNFSNARCIWDAAATHTVASWEQTAAFTGTIELQTTYESGAFAALAITGDCTINGGTMTQTANSNSQAYRLSLTVGRNLNVASGTQITATGKGYASGYPNGVTAGTHGGSVVVTGTATVDGQLLARPSASDKENHIFGAGGSICVSASSISGSGSINASGYGSQYGGRAGGGGGRVALFVTGADSMEFPLSNVTATGTVGAWNTSGGAGTVFVKTRQQANGTLVVDDVTVTQTEYRQYLHTRHAATPIPPGETWTLDELRFRNSGILVVPEGTTLNIPLAAISSTSDRTAGILYEGGTINFTDVQPGGPYALTGKWVFQASSPYTFDGNVTISGGAAIGGLRMSGTFDDFATCDVTVNGDLSVAADGWLYADSSGLAGGASGFTTGPARHGGQMAGSSGNICYDSIFAPCLPAVNSVLSHEKESPGGGVIKLMVNGALTLDGKATAEGPVRYKGAGSGGTINITAQTLSGSGSISASGTAGTIAWDEAYNGAGGRIAVRVTGENVGTNGVWTKIYARGVATNQVNTANARNQNCSAGTIYLQGKSDGEKGGTIYVRNQKNYDTSDVATWIPAAARGDAAVDFANAKLVIADRGVVAIGAAKMKLAELTIESNSLLDLHGKTLVVKSAKVNGVKLASGTYAAGSTVEIGEGTLANYLVDTATGGALVVSGGGLSIIVR